MRNSRSYKYKNYGSIPQNEYGTNNTEKNTGSTAPLEYNPGAMAYRQRLIKRQALHPSGLRKIYGWAHTWKTNGWRAESASQDDEFTIRTGIPVSEKEPSSLISESWRITHGFSGA